MGQHNKHLTFVSFLSVSQESARIPRGAFLDRSTLTSDRVACHENGCSVVLIVLCLGSCNAVLDFVIRYEVSFVQEK